MFSPLSFLISRFDVSSLFHEVERGDGALPMGQSSHSRKFNQYTLTAIKAARKGSEALLYFFSRRLDIHYKGSIDPVTQADKASQEAVCKVIHSAFPGHAIQAEEGRDDAPANGFRWIVDPLDGTVNYIHGVPLFAVSVALQYRGRIISGVVYAPRVKEMFVGEKGGGAWLNGVRLRVSAQNKVIRSLAVTGFSYDIHDKPGHALASLKNVLVSAQGVRRFGSAAIDLAYVAAGRCDAFWEEGLKPWDVAAGALIVNEAGGKVTDLAGGKDYLTGKSILASNGRIHRPMLSLISGPMPRKGKG